MDPTASTGFPRECSHETSATPGGEHRPRRHAPAGPGGSEPDPVWAAVLAELGGADGITVHLREDRRHIQDRDLRLLRETVRVRLNLELAAEPEIVAIALAVRPDQVTFVPERRAELTTEGGLDVAGQAERVAEAVARCRDAGLEVSLFIDPDPAQVEASRRLGAEAVELHTGRYADAPDAAGRARELAALALAGSAAVAAGLAPARRPRPELPERRAGREPGRAWPS